MRELTFVRHGKLAWRDAPSPVIQSPDDALVRPFLAGRCDGDTVPIHRPVSRALQAGLKAGLVDPAVGRICGCVPFRGPFAIGHECVAQVIAVGARDTVISVGHVVVVPWAISCGRCGPCLRGLTSKCSATTESELAAFGFGPASGPWGGMITDLLRVPHAEHMLVPLYVDDDTSRLELAASFGATAVRAAASPRIGHRRSPAWGARSFDIAVEATSSATGLRQAIRALAAGGTCTAVGYYLAAATPIPLMRMYATSATLKLGVSHAGTTHHRPTRHGRPRSSCNARRSPKSSYPHSRAAGELTQALHCDRDRRPLDVHISAGSAAPPPRRRRRSDAAGGRGATRAHR